MAAPRRWIRLDVGWEDSWLDELTGAAAGCWPRLLCWVKRDGVQGRCKRPRTEKLARVWRVTVADILELEAAAVRDGALRMDGNEWVVPNWLEYNPLDAGAAQRKRRQRAKEDGHAESRESRVTNGTGRDGRSRDVDVDVDVDVAGSPELPEKPDLPENPRAHDEFSNGVAPELDDEPEEPPESGFIHPTQRMSASQVLYAWESRQPSRLPQADRQRHSRIARRLADGHTAQEIVLAFVGMSQLFPYSTGEPWDLFDLDRKFAKATAKARDHPDLRRMQREAEIMQLLEAG